MLLGGARSIFSVEEKRGSYFESVKVGENK
jgi:hypothetical protein